MVRYRQYTQPVCLRKRARFFLASAWFWGLVFGAFLSSTASASLSSLMRSVLSDSVSIVSAVCVNVLPFLITVFAGPSRPCLILSICFLRGFLFSFVSMNMFLLFGSSGWLLRQFYLFSDCLSVPLYYLVWHDCIAGGTSLLKHKTALLGFGGLLITALDFCVISPFVVRLIDF